MMSFRNRIPALALLLLLASWAGANHAQTVSAGGQSWPRQFQSGTTSFTVYQPQVESWAWRNLSGRVAVSVKDAASPQEQFGVVWFTAQTNVNRAANLVTLDDIQLTKASFPASPGQADT